MKPQSMNNLIAAWVVICARQAKWVCAIFFVLFIVLTNYTINNLGINTKTTDMLSEQLEWRQNLIEHEKHFPHLTDTLVAVIDAQTPMLAIEARDKLAAGLKKYEDEFYQVYLPSGGDFFRQHGLLFLEVEQLDELIDQLTQIQPLLGRLERGERLSGFFNLLEQSIKYPDQGDYAAVLRLVERTANAVKALQANEFHRMRWHEGGKSNTRQLILLKPKLVFEQLLPAKQSIQTLYDVADELNLNQQHGVQIRLTGTIALQSDELKLLASSMPFSGLLAFILVSLVLFFAMRHSILILSSVTTLLIGLIITGAFAAFSVGHLNLVSVAFAILFIGLGVDFAIHFCLRYKELLAEKIPHYDALRITGSDVGTSLMLCSITTSVGFFAFIPTSFKGVSELGIISGGGMLISLVTTLTLLPALLSLKPIQTSNLFDRTGRFSRTTSAIGERLINQPKNSRRLLAIFSIIIIASLFFVPSISFDNNPINLRSPKSESVSAYSDLLSDKSTSPMSLSTISTDLQKIDALGIQLEALTSVNKVVSISDFIPDQQADKLDLFADLEFILGGTSKSINLKNGEKYQQQIEAIDNLINQLSQSRALNDAEPLKQLQASLIVLRENLTQSTTQQQLSQLINLSDSLLGDLLAQINAVRDGISSNGLTQGDLPAELLSRWKSDEGQYKLHILPEGDMTNNAEATHFIGSTRALAPNATGAAIVNFESGLAIVQSFQQAFVSAFLLIFLLLLLLLRRLSDAVLVLTPLVLTAPLVVAATVLLDIPFNYANIITLPLLLGISVDNGVHMIHRARHAPSEDNHLLASSTGRAVVFSAATTVVSFGNLAFSPHVGTASMGLLLSIGMVCSLFCTLILLPILINRFIKT